MSEYDAFSEQLAFQGCKAQLAKTLRGNMEFIGQVLTSFAVVLFLASITGLSICFSKDEVDE